MVKETDARTVLNSERIDYWLSVGAQPSDNVRVLIKKYGTDGTHLEQQQAALERLKIKPVAPPPVPISLKPDAAPAAEAASAERAESTAAQTTESAAAVATEEAPQADASATETTASDKAEADKPEATE